MSETVEISGVEFPKNDLEIAISRLDNPEDGRQFWGDVAMFGDGDDDDAVYIINRDSGEATPSYVYLDTVKDKLNEDMEEPLLCLESDYGDSITIPVDADYEVAVTDSSTNNFVVGVDADDVVDGVLNSSSSHEYLDGDWDGTWFFKYASIEQA